MKHPNMIKTTQDVQAIIQYKGLYRVNYDKEGALVELFKVAREISWEFKGDRFPDLADVF